MEKKRRGGGRSKWGRGKKDREVGCGGKREGYWRLEGGRGEKVEGGEGRRGGRREEVREGKARGGGTE